MIGKYPAKLDDKNRLFVPAKLREELGDEFYVTFGTNGGHRCLTIYPAAAWQRLTENYNALSQAQRAKGPNILFNNAIQCNPDKQFRFALNLPYAFSPECGPCHLGTGLGFCEAGCYHRAAQLHCAVVPPELRICGRQLPGGGG